MTTTLLRNEVLLSAYDAHGRAVRRVEGGDLSSEAIRGEIRAINVLLDACIDCGMSVDHADMSGWAAERVTSFLLSGVE